MQSDPKEALEYVACICLTCDQSDAVGKEQMELACEQTRRIVVQLDADAKWQTIVGHFRADGTRIVRCILPHTFFHCRYSYRTVLVQSGAIEAYTRLLRLADSKAYNEHVLLPAAAETEREGRFTEAIRLYNLAGAYETVIACLARVLGESVTEPSAATSGLEATAREIIRHYERTNRVAGQRGVVLKLLNAREARECKDAGRLDRALELMESMELVPLNGDQAAIRRAGEAVMHQDDAISRNLGYFLQIMVEILRQQRETLRYANSVDQHVRFSFSLGLLPGCVVLTLKRRHSDCPCCARRRMRYRASRVRSGENGSARTCTSTYRGWLLILRCRYSHSRSSSPGCCVCVAVLQMPIPYKHDCLVEARISQTQACGSPLLLHRSHTSAPQQF